MDDTGRVDNPPVIANPIDAALDVSQVRDAQLIWRCENTH
jgi:hypothetical protein